MIFSLASISSAKGDILYGGVIVERACEETKHRFVFILFIQVALHESAVYCKVYFI